MTTNVHPTTVADLKPGDFFQHNDVHPEPVEVLWASRPYSILSGTNSGDRVMIAYVYPWDGNPMATRMLASDEVHVPSAAEVADAKAVRERAAFIAGIRDFATWLEGNPELPQPDNAFFQHSMITGTDAEKIDVVRAVAEHLGVTADITPDDATVRAEPVPRIKYVIHGFIGTRGDSAASPVTRHFSFGHGQTDPDTGEDLLDKYVTVIAPTVAACRDAMFASRYGQAWAFDYDPSDATWREWGPRWTEHERIVADVPGPDAGSHTT
jgi:hypothetical protein